MKKSDYIEEYASDGSFSDVSDGKESACNAGHPGLIAGSGKSPGERNDYQLQYCLEKVKDREAWAIICEITKSWTQLSN